MVVGDHQFLARTGDRVVEHDLQRALGDGVRIAEAGYIHAEQLELGGGIRLGEGRLATGEHRGIV